MSNKKLFKNFMKYVSLNVIGMIGLSCYILADTFFVANGLGNDGLAALNIALPIYTLVNATGLMLAIGGATRYGILKAREEDELANKVFTHSVICGLTFGGIFLLLGVFFSGNLTRLLGADETIFEMTNTYLKMVLVFSPFFILNNIFIAFIRNDDAPRLSMTAMLIGSFSNIVLDYVFIMIFRWGMFGAVFATGLAPIVSMSILSIHLFKKNNKFHLSLKSKFKMKYATDIVQLGISSFVNEMASGIILLVFNIIILGISGNLGVAAYGVVSNLAFVVVEIYVGLGQGIQPILSENHGNGNKKNVKLILKYGIISSLILAVLVYIVVFNFSDGLIALFNKDKDLILADLARDGLKIYFTGFVFVGLNIVISSFLSSVEEVRKAFFVSLLRGGMIIVPLAFILSSLFKMAGVWVSFPISEGITTVIAIMILYTVGKRSKA